MSENDGMTLLQKALRADVGRNSRIKDPSVIRQRAELALAFAMGKINGAQFKAATGGASTEGAAGNYLMRSIRAGIVKCTMVPEEPSK